VTASEEDRIAELVGQSRFERKRKLLPNLRLKYPNDHEMLKLANLAKVNHHSFGGTIRNLILSAHENNSSFRNLSAPKVRSTLKTIARQAQQLEEILNGIDVQSEGSKQRAGRMLEWELGKLRKGADFLLPQYISSLNHLSDAARRAAMAVTSKRGPKGAGANFAFDLFIQGLLITARQHYGGWTLYRSKDRTWRGSLLTALIILKNYLPRNFFPPGDLGTSIDHIKTKFYRYIAKNRADDH
jgi:hypothetical protein